MPNVYVIADTHFGHKAVINFEHGKRPFDTIEEHDEALVENWNSVVTPFDTVIHLGDVLFGQDSFRYLHKLHGIKRLVMGNHDHYPIERYLNHFQTIHGAYEYKSCILTHIPVHPRQFPRYRLNVHGHTHSGFVRLEEFPGQPDAPPDPRYVCVSVEHTNLKPILLSNIIDNQGLPALA